MFSSFKRMPLKKYAVALTSVAQSVGCCPVKQLDFPGQGTCYGCGPGLWLGCE